MELFGLIGTKHKNPPFTGTLCETLYLITGRPVNVHFPPKRSEKKPADTILRTVCPILFNIPQDKQNAKKKSEIIILYPVGEKRGPAAPAGPQRGEKEHLKIVKNCAMIRYDSQYADFSLRETVANNGKWGTL
jgi:hypothetical protein